MPNTCFTIISLTKFQFTICRNVLHAVSELASQVTLAPFMLRNQSTKCGNNLLRNQC